MSKDYERTRNPRLMLSVGGYCRDLLRLSAFINSRAIASEATSILCDSLVSQEHAIRDRIEFIAKQRGISAEDLIKEVLSEDT